MGGRNHVPVDMDKYPICLQTNHVSRVHLDWTTINHQQFKHSYPPYLPNVLNMCAPNSPSKKKETTPNTQDKQKNIYSSL